MNGFWFTFWIIVIAAVFLFFAKFSRFGTIDFKTAWKGWTLWWSGVFAVFGQFIAELLAWFAQLWEPLQAEAGDLLANPSFGKALQIIGLLAFIIRSKAQGLPSTPKLPDFPDLSKPAR